ncbi:HD domain-containing protein [Morganella psychrotolerans]|uniref:Bifunctional (P)ppGpp synthetase/guanosine-3',5'-bis(Diphosphate) 3'-pyrophosphohydrolase n=1 Tax=Morganella psychrotolerans TaxID=368603 RepID=A0A5M9QZJ6_9GAMM|nr:HD domain-containing protein [Morganella psychrotolerans]KAA8712976.1 bifunctional (p)ppGpp synthetase/guanosine-3',5'-bis(diphosphate) 3'-pyrophosphohydrolase [Morganella psychrotolerans]OBU01923.1 hypothetical protein AYY16_17090 [Morganella psychrotolerans]
MIDLIKKSRDFAEKAHAGQKRKYTGEDYITHPVHVAQIVGGFAGSTQEMTIAALLHDVVEDTGVTLSEIRLNFGDEVAELVHCLTNIRFTEKQKESVFSRPRRYGMNAAKIFFQDNRAANTIKIADMMSNLSNVFDHDRKYGTRYLAEKTYLCDNIISRNCNPAAVHEFYALASLLYDDLNQDEKTRYGMHYNTLDNATKDEILRRDPMVTVSYSAAVGLKPAEPVFKSAKDLQPNDVINIIGGWYRVRYINYRPYEISVQLQRKEHELSPLLDQTCMTLSVDRNLNVLFPVEVSNESKDTV